MRDSAVSVIENSVSDEATTGKALVSKLSLAKLCQVCLPTFSWAIKGGKALC